MCLFYEFVCSTSYNTKTILIQTFHSSQSHYYKIIYLNFMQRQPAFSVLQRLIQSLSNKNPTLNNYNMPYNLSIRKCVARFIIYFNPKTRYDK